MTEALQAVTRWTGDYAVRAAHPDIPPQPCGRAEAQRTVREASRRHLSVTARPEDGIMVVTVGPGE